MQCSKSGQRGSCLAIAAPRQAHREHRAFARLARHRYVAAHNARELAGDGTPSLVNLQALLNRLNRICRRRMRSSVRAKIVRDLGREAVLILVGTRRS